MASPKDWEPIVKPFGNVKTPQPEACPGSSKPLPMASDKELDPNPRPSPNVDNTNKQGFYTSSPAKQFMTKSNGILEKKISPVIQTFPCLKFVAVQSPVADVPSTRVSFPSVNN
ncbi:hypothetical protein O181_004960 [Austropuccinia psidii MF-1]|uniref:Uncharacterized protein n=1 Tax=Austropuccinia psidii MF-1 TaxID=1389203 RepID=A0A9Q3BHG6_9BASI|nr:hypothetical protein [Austropuccinia psidii MF-1]